MSLVIVNVKTYDGSYGRRGLELAKTLDSASSGTGVKVALAVQAVDIRYFVDNTELDIYAQHIDPWGAGGHTGSVLPEAVKEAAAVGVLINHSERRLTLADIEANITRAKECGLATVVCSNNEATSVASAVMKPDFIAVEPPELIGGDISVSKARPEVISNTVDMVRKVSADVGILCGAGVKDGGDVAKAVELGAEGILVASGVVKVADPAEALKDLISGF